MQIATRKLTHCVCGRKLLGAASKLYSTSTSASQGAEPVRASDFLRQQAEQEEKSEQSSPKKNVSYIPPGLDHQPWTGDEEIKDAVLRMLVDKYKPLRIKDAVKKTQQPRPATSNDFPSAPPSIPSVHSSSSLQNPWDHDLSFKSPAEISGLPNVHYGIYKSDLKPSSARISGKSVNLAAKISIARDATVEYTLGNHDEAKARTLQTSTRKRSEYLPSPTDMRGWNSLIEDRIEKAKRSGAFNNIQGRGKPMVKDRNEDNPYLDRTEFLMNRIVQKQNAAPPWIEMQKEMRAEIDVFRARLIDDWTRRATRMICAAGKLTEASIQSSGKFRDREWEEAEKSYHQTSLQQINSLVRKYNTLAPPSVRVAILDLEAERTQCYTQSAPLIAEELEKRLKEGPGTAAYAILADEDSSTVHNGGQQQKASRDGVWRTLRYWIVKAVAGEPSKT